MKVGWLLDANAFDTYHDELAAAIIRNGHTVKSVHRPKPPYGWGDASQVYRKAFAADACVVTHADIDLVARVLSEGNWTPGAFATIRHFFWTRYYIHFGRFLLNGDHAILPFAELEHSADRIFDTFGRAGKIFVRPDSPLKLFAGLLADRATLAKDLEFMSFYEFPADSLVVVSSPKTIEAEWRFVVARQTVVTGSQYRDADQLVASPGVDPQARQLADAILATGYSPDPVWVMDICRTTDGQYRLVEIGGFSFSNLYACDKDAVVQAVSEVAVELHRAAYA